jgi:hypothetical protein
MLVTGIWKSPRYRRRRCGLVLATRQSRKTEQKIVVVQRVATSALTLAVGKADSARRWPAVRMRRCAIA